MEVVKTSEGETDRQGQEKCGPNQESMAKFASVMTRVMIRRRGRCGADYTQVDTEVSIEDDGTEVRVRTCV